MKTKALGEIRLRELNLFIELLKTKSVRELARAHGCSAGQISKQIKALELKLGIKLVERSNYGVEATPEAIAILPYMEDIDSLGTKLNHELNPKTQSELLSIASITILATYLISPALTNYQEQSPNTRFRLLEFPPSQLVSVGLRGGFQICVHLEEIDWPKTWTSTRVGDIQWQLYCRKDHPLPEKPSLKQILKYPFVYPSYWSEQGIRYGDDSCPLAIQKRILGFETSTSMAAVEIVKHSNQLGFFLTQAAHIAVKGKELRAVPIKAWSKVSKPVYLTVKNDFIKQSTFKLLQQLLQERLSLLK